MTEKKANKKQIDLSQASLSNTKPQMESEKS